MIVEGVEGVKFNHDMNKRKINFLLSEAFQKVTI
tara:strand:+ start:1889 stop:1990 length:102 start_codon:yes stop_codon:yes gene_type:complete